MSGTSRIFMHVKSHIPVLATLGLEYINMSVRKALFGGERHDIDKPIQQLLPMKGRGIN